MVSVPCLSSAFSSTATRKPSSRRSSAIRFFIFEAGTSTLALRAVIALRSRVRKSAIGSVIGVVLPARLDDAGDIPLERQVAETDAAKLELAHERARPAAHRATVAPTHGLHVAGDVVRKLPLARDHLRKAG